MSEKDNEKILKSRFMVIRQLCREIDLDVLGIRLSKTGASVDECRRFLNEIKNFGRSDRQETPEEHIHLKNPRLFDNSQKL